MLSILFAGGPWDGREMHYREVPPILFVPDCYNVTTLHVPHYYSGEPAPTTHRLHVYRRAAIAYRTDAENVVRFYYQGVQ